MPLRIANLGEAVHERVAVRAVGLDGELREH